MALENNPTLKQAEAMIEAAKGRARQAGMLPNPTIGYTGEEVSGGPTIRGGEHGIFYEQTIPLGGKLRLSRDVFQQEVRQAEIEREAQRYRIINTVRMAYYATLAAARRVEVRERLAQVASEAVTVSAQLYNVGAADRPDLLEAGIEARQNRLDLVAARNELYRSWRRLANAVGDPMLSPRPLVGSLETDLPEVDREAALHEILTKSPELRAANAGVERVELALKRARREPVPDLVIRGGPRYNRELLETRGERRRPVGWEAAVDIGFVIPLFNRNQGNVAAAEADLARAREEVRRIELLLRSRLATVFDEYLTALRMAEVYRGEIVPRAEEAYQLYLARFREMGAAYPQVLIAQRSLFQVSDQYVSAVETVWQSAVQIQGLLLTGGLEAPPVPGEEVSPRPGLRVEPGEMPRAVRPGTQVAGVEGIRR